VSLAKIGSKAIVYISNSWASCLFCIWRVVLMVVTRTKWVKSWSRFYNAMQLHCYTNHA